MLETYKNILANKFMRDTNYIIIKDTDDIEELQREWDLFQTQMTKKQQEKSDERSIEIWRMTNQEHYETLRDSLIDEFEQTHSVNDDTLEQQNDYEEEEEKPEEDDTPENLVNTSLDNLEIPDDENDITEPMKEDVSNTQKDNIADQFEIDTGINIISTIHGKDTDEMLDSLEKQFTEYNSQSKDHKLRSDDESIAIYNKTNVDRYNDIKGFLLKSRQIENSERVTSTDGKTLKADTTHYFGEFVSQVYQNMQAVNEAESLKSKQHRRFNDCPYFTPSEMIDMGVYTNGNFYSPFADNDGLITGVRIPLWFDSYKNMCMDHIFEDYRSDWIDTLDKLYSDFEDIKASGNEEKILARKQSILDLGWNPEIAFNRKNRLKASKRVSDILDKTIPKDVFINLDDIPESDDEILSESVSKSTHKPVFLIFTQGSTPIVSQGIKLFTGSEYSHASISFDPELNEVYSFNIREKSGFIRENLSSFGENVISVMTFFAPNKIVQQLKDKVKDFEDNKTTFDLRIFLNKILHIDHKVSKNEYHQVCSTFVDTVLKSGSINLTGDINIPDPGQLYDHAKSMPNKIIEVFNDKAPKYDGKKTKRKLTTLLKSSDIEGIEESYKNDSIQSQVDSIINDTITYLKHYTSTPQYKSKYSKYRFFKLINIHKVEYGTYGGIMVVNDSPYQNSSELYDIDYDSDKIDKNAIDWYNDLLKKGKSYAKSKCNDSLLRKIDIDSGDGDEGVIYFNKKKNLSLYDKMPKHHKNENVPSDNPYKNLKTSEQIALGVGMGIGDVISKALFKESTSILNEACKDIKSAREFVSKVGELAKKYDANYFIVTDGASGIHNNGNPAVKNARDSQIKWEKKHGFDPDEDWSKKSIKESSFINDKGQTVPKKCPECGSDVGVFIEGEPIYRCTNKECKKYFGVVKPPTHKSIREQTSILNEVKQFPVEFDKEGNLIIYKARTGTLAFGDEIDDSVQLLESYRNQSNIEGMKYEIAKLWYINDCIEKKLKKRLSNDQYKELIDNRSVCLNSFKYNLEYIMKYEKGFNFSDYYNSTPFSDNSVKITSNTIDYTIKTIKGIL